MSSGRIASRYANALIDLAVERGIARELYTQSQVLTSVMANDPDFYRLLADLSFPTKQKMAALEKALAHQVNPLLLDLINLMLKKHRTSYIYTALLLFQERYREQHNILEVIVESAKPLLDKELARIKEHITARYKATIDVRNVVKPELLGGIVLLVDGNMLDLSVAGELKNVRKALGTS